MTKPRTSMRRCWYSCAVRTVQLHAAAGADEDRLRRVRRPRADPADQHAHRHDGKHLRADHSPL